LIQRGIVQRRWIPVGKIFIYIYIFFSGLIFISYIFLGPIQIERKSKRQRRGCFLVSTFSVFSWTNPNWERKAKEKKKQRFREMGNRASCFFSSTFFSWVALFSFFFFAPQILFFLPWKKIHTSANLCLRYKSACAFHLKLKWEINYSYLILFYLTNLKSTKELVNPVGFWFF
jgi:hypothetical protein